MKLTPSQLERCVNCARAIQQIPAPTFSEENRALYIQNLWQESGLEDVTRDSIGNVYARFPGSGSARPVVVSAHLDTVFPPDTDLSLRVTSARIYGPGIGDNSLGLAGLTGLAWLLKESDHPAGLPGDVWLAATVGEEGLGDLRGMRAAVERFGGRPAAYIVLEGLGLGRIVHRGIEVHRVRITLRTAGGHSWLDYGKPSAVHELVQLAARITALHPAEIPRTTLNIGVIQGGISVNSIAPQAAMEVDLRSENAAGLAGLLSQVEAETRAIIRPGVQVSLETIGRRPSGEVSPSHPLVRLACRCAMEAGETPALQTGSTDANIPLSLGLPAVCIGLAHGGGAHTRGEYIRTSSLKKGMSQLVQLVSKVWAEGV